MELANSIIDVYFNLPKHLDAWAEQMGWWLYVLLFAIIFAETGLVVMPFLPGDSLLFAVGVLTATPDLPLVIVLLIVAAVLGDAVNYTVGYRLGPKVFRSESSWLFNKQHLVKTQRFYEKYGGKTIILARFIPIIRTFAPFVAGIGKMAYGRFAVYNVTGGIIWVLLFVLGGWYFGNTEIVKRNFHIVIVVIIVISVMPPVIEYFLARRRGPETKPAAAPAENAEAQAAHSGN